MWPEWAIKLARIVAAWIGKHVFAFAFFNDFAVFQHHHAVGNGADHGEVVADDDEGEAVFFLQAAEQFKDLLLPWTSSALVGSSNTRIFGRTMMARAMARRWRWPPENACG